MNFSLPGLELWLIKWTLYIFYFILIRVMALAVLRGATDRRQETKVSLVDSKWILQFFK